MRILVTGAAGFVGSALCEKLARFGHEVIGTDNFSPYYSVELKTLRVNNLIAPFGIKVVAGDLADSEFVTSLFDTWTPDVVVHLAAQAGVRIPRKSQDQYVKSNLVGFANVLREASLHSVTSFLFASSSSVYGDQQGSVPFVESLSELTPTSFYGSTKLCNEILGKHEASVSRMRIRGLRFFTAYGPWGRPDMAYFRMISSALNQTTFQLYGDGKIKRDFTFIEDIVFSVIELLTELQSHPEGFFDVVNVGGGNPVSMEELVESVKQITNTDFKVETTAPNPLDSSITWASTVYLQSLIGSRPFTKLNEGITESTNWAIQPQYKSKLDTWARSVI